MSRPKRPDMRAYFLSRIDWHTNGLLGPVAGLLLPNDVAKVTGDVTDRLIVVTMRDGTVWAWRGGRFSKRKRNLCYPPLMPRPLPHRPVA